MMRNIGAELNAASDGALELRNSNPWVLDLCMAPGGYTAAVLDRNRDASVCALTLPQHLGGHRIIHPKDTGLQVMFEDITMLYKEFGLTDIPQDHPNLLKFSDKRWWYGKEFDLIFCDGQALRTHEPNIGVYGRQVEALRLNVSQLILAMQRMKRGGTLIMLLHHMDSYETIKILRVFDEIARIQLFKPLLSHMNRSSFYLIAKNVEPGHLEAVVAVNEWKKVWKDLTFPVLDEDGQALPPKIASEPEVVGEVSDLLDTLGERIIELGEPIWQIQKEALATANWTRRKEAMDSEQDGTVEASAAAIAVHASEEDLDNVGDADDMETAPVLGKASKPPAEGPVDSADMSVAMQSLDIDS